MFTLLALLALAAPPDYSSVPTPKFTAKTITLDLAAIAKLPTPKFPDEQVEEKPVAKPKPLPVAKVAAKPYVDPPGTHRHRCDFDGTIWSHATGGSHNCPACGRLQYYHYTGPNQPTVLPKLKSDATPLYSIPGLYRSRDNCPTST